MVSYYWFFLYLLWKLLLLLLHEMARKIALKPNKFSRALIRTQNEKHVLISFKKLFHANNRCFIEFHLVRLYSTYIVAQ